MLWTHFPNTHCTCHSSHSQLFPIFTVCYCGLYNGDTCTVLSIPVSQSPTCFVFCRVGFLFFIKGLTCNWTHTSFLPRAPSPCRDTHVMTPLKRDHYFNSQRRFLDGIVGFIGHKGVV